MNGCNAVTKTEPQQEMEFRPYADTFEKLDSYVIELDLPGADPGSIELTTQDRILSVQARATAEVPEGLDSVYRGFGSGVYSRWFRLPQDVDASAIEAKCTLGVLRVVLPKQPEAKPRRIDVTVN